MQNLGKLLGAALLAALILVGCQQDDAAASVAETLRDDGRFDTLSSLLEEGETQSLQSGSFTIFAPTDEAFEALYEEVGSVAPERLRQILRYHLAPEGYTAEDLIALDGESITTLEGSNIDVSVEDGAVILNGSVKVTQADIFALDGIIHVIDAVLIPPDGDDEDSEGEAATFESTPELATVQDETVTDSLEIDDPRYLSDLSVTLDLAHPFVFDLVLTLEHEETGTVVTLVEKPRSDEKDIKTTFTDSAELGQGDIAYDPEAELETAFPEAEYRPLEPLEFFYGEQLAGTWTLSVRDDVDNPDSGTLNAWSLNFSAAEERPAGAIYLTPGGSNVNTLVPGTTEALVFNVKRLADLEGEITLSAESAEGLQTEAVTIDADAEQGIFPVEVSEGADLGEQTLTVTARSGDAERQVTLDLTLAPFDQHDVELLAYLPLAAIGAPDGSGNDIWGWTDGETGSDIAMMGMTTGVAFVDVSDPDAPVYLGLLPTHSPEDESGNTWRDIKVYKNHAFVVSEAEGHGMQIFDLTQLRTVTEPQTFEETAHYDGFGNAHNIVIDEETGYAYSVGATEEQYEQVCFGGLLMLDISEPTSPEFAGCFAGGVPEGKSAGEAYPTDVYVHDAQCVIYEGPDEDYEGREICLTSDGQINEGSADYLGIADVTDKDNVAQVSRVEYEGAGYAHQGWLTEDHAYFLFNDELDELDNGIDTSTYIWDVRDLDNPVLLGTFKNPRDAIGHNTYTLDDYAYQANYTSGLRVVDLTDIEAIEEIAYFDTYPEDDEDNPDHDHGDHDHDDAGDAELRTQSCAAGGAETQSLRALYHPEENPLALACIEEAAFSGLWSNYPYFDDIVVLSDIDRGFFVVKPEIHDHEH